MKKNKNTGFIKLIILIIAGVIILGALNVDIREKIPQDKIALGWNLAKKGWNKCVKRPAEYIINYLNLK